VALRRHRSNKMMGVVHRGDMGRVQIPLFSLIPFLKKL
jgi:hypothetical protein